MRLLIVCPYPPNKAPSQRFRFEQYLEGLNFPYRQVGFWKDSEWPKIYQSGNLFFKVSRTLWAFVRRFFLLFTVWKYDKVFVHREATPIGPPWFEWFVVKVFHKPLVYDFDDAIWLPNVSEANKGLIGGMKSHSKVGKICRWAGVVIVGNSFLGDYAQRVRAKSALRYNQSLLGLITPGDIPFDTPRIAPLRTKASRDPSGDISASIDGQHLITDLDDGVVVIPTTIDTEGLHNPDLYSVKGGRGSSFDTSRIAPRIVPLGTKASRDTHDYKGKMLQTIGWTGTHSTLKQLIPLFPLLEEVHKAHPFHFLLIADKAPEEMPGFVEFVKWNKKTEIPDLMRIDIGVMPLYDTDWEKGKCGFKALQYMALGIPAVVSDVGVNPEILVDEATGCVCEAVPCDGVKWKWDLLRLLGDASLRKGLGVKGRERVVEFYSVEAWRDVYFSVLKK